MKSNKISLVAILIIFASIFYFNFTNIPHKVFAYDNWGYYMYLPNIIIEGQVSLKNIDFIKEINEQYKLSPTLYQLIPTDNQSWVIKYSIGLSILLLPFFLIAHLIASLTGFPADGYSAPYFYAIWIASPIYVSFGIYMLRKILLKYLDDLVTAVTLITLYFATNFFFFSSLGNPLPHILVFTEYTVLIWVTIKWHETHRISYARFIGLMIGIITISRASEVISLLIPLLWGIYNKETLLQKIKLVFQYKTHFIQLILFAFIGGFPQMLYWYLASGKILFNSYNDHASQLVLSDPQFFKVLFSYRKGWFIYAPLMVFSVIGFINLYQKKKEIFWSIFVVFFLNLYLLASFTSLFSFGFRAFIQSYAFMVIPLGFFIQFIVRKSHIAMKALATIVLIGFIYLTYFQSKQIQMGTIHGSRMTKEYYWAVFMKKFPTEEDKKLLLIERSETARDTLKNESDFLRRIEISNDFEIPDGSSNYDTSIVYEGKYSYKIDENIVYGPALELTFKDVTDDYFAYFRPSIWVYPDYQLSAHNVHFVFTFENDGTSYKYKSYNLSDPKLELKSGEWNKIQMDYLSPELLSRKDKIKFYIWNQDQQQLYIDHMQIESFTRDLD